MRWRLWAWGGRAGHVPGVWGADLTPLPRALACPGSVVGQGVCGPAGFSQLLRGVKLRPPNPCVQALTPSATVFGVGLSGGREVKCGRGGAPILLRRGREGSLSLSSV